MLVQKKIQKQFLVPMTATLMLALSACGGGSSGGAAQPLNPPPPPPPAITTAEAFQFLNQATFGATDAEAQRVINMGFADWIDDQMQQPASLQLPHLRALPAPMFPFELQADRVDMWFRNAINGDDQLRQRVAFALSEIMVVSQLGALVNAPFSLADYYDQLALHAFGNYRDLMEVVTLHPAMGVYLSMLGNEKPNPALNIRPDENYARELMQLFTIGLVELNPDGSPRLDAQGREIPTYDQAVIEGFAHVNTGWHYAGAPSFEFAFPTAFNQTIPMQLYPAFHDPGPKMVLNGVTIPAGQTGDQDLAMALDNIFNHSNVGPFLSYRLIQRLVTSNPSPGYVERIAAVFDNNGSGVRGDLGAVVEAILLDAEARPDLVMEIDGKLKEPLLRLTQLWRAYNARSQSGKFPLAGASFVFGQGPLQSPSVFNFFSPFFAPAGEIRNAGFVAPELEIATEYQNTFVTNYLLLTTFGWHSENQNLAPDDVFIDISEEIAIADDTEALIDMVAAKLLAGDISAVLRTEIAGMVNRIPIADAVNRTAEAIFLVVSSPEFAYQH
jgi:uncharacterized protein (DUF1800 family)